MWLREIYTGMLLLFRRSYIYAPLDHCHCVAFHFQHTVIPHIKIQIPPYCGQAGETIRSPGAIPSRLLVPPITSRTPLTGPTEGMPSSDNGVAFSAILWMVPSLRM